MRPHLAHQLKAMFGPPPTDGIGLGIVVEKLVGIQVRSVGGEKEQLDFPLLSRDPCAHPAGAVDRVAVDDQENAPMASLFEQAFAKVKKDTQPELPLEDHETQLAPVCNRRDHVAAKALAGAWDNRRFALRRIRTTSLMVGSQPHLVAPIQQSFLRFRPAMDAWVFDLRTAAGSAS